MQPQIFHETLRSEKIYGSSGRGGDARLLRSGSDSPGDLGGEHEDGDKELGLAKFAEFVCRASREQVGH